MSLENATKHFEATKQESLEWLFKELSGLRSGRITPDTVTSVTVDYYGTRNQIQGLASVSNLNARTLIISPWDKGAVPAIEKALIQANIGAMPTVDGQVLRLSFPTPTQEVREQTVKQLHKKAEEARVRLRVGRDEALKPLKREKEDGKLSEDEFYQGKEKLDKLIDGANKEILSIVEKKEAEITKI